MLAFGGGKEVGAWPVPILGIGLLLAGFGNVGLAWYFSHIVNVS